MAIVPMQREHWPQVRSIYAQGIATGHATFETEAPEWERWDATHNPASRLVATVDDRIVGWAALAPVSPRHVYRGVGEVSVYIAASERGKGLGRRLLERLTIASEEQQIWTLQAGIFPENVASLSLHLRCGFRRVGVREKIGQMRGSWRNVVLLERRSFKFR